MINVKEINTKTLRELPDGESIAWVMKDARQIFSAKAIAYRLQRELGCKFETKTNFDNNLLTITKRYERGIDSNDKGGTPADSE